MTGCTAFLVQMMTTPDAKLVKADPQKLAERYGLAKWSWGPGWCEMRLDAWKHRT